MVNKNKEQMYYLVDLNGNKVGESYRLVYGAIQERLRLKRKYNEITIIKREGMDTPYQSKTYFKKPKIPKSNTPEIVQARDWKL